MQGFSEIHIGQLKPECQATAPFRTERVADGKCLVAEGLRRVQASAYGDLAEKRVYRVRRLQYPLA